MKFRAFAILACFTALNAYASCTCKCVNGQVQAVCDNAMDLQPICPPQLCPMTPPSLKPMQMPTLPPLGTSQCEQEQVYNSMTGAYEWQELCR